MEHLGALIVGVDHQLTEVRKFNLHMTFLLERIARNEHQVNSQASEGTDRQDEVED